MEEKNKIDANSGSENDELSDEELDHVSGGLNDNKWAGHPNEIGDFEVKTRVLTPNTLTQLFRAATAAESILEDNS